MSNRLLTLDEDEIRDALDDSTIAAILAKADPSDHPAHTIREGIVAALCDYDDRIATEPEP